MLYLLSLLLRQEQHFQLHSRHHRCLLLQSLCRGQQVGFQGCETMLAALPLVACCCPQCCDP